MSYRAVRAIAEIRDYLGDASVVSFDFETAPTLRYRADDRAALDAHKACIVGISLSVQEGTAIYIPLRHITGGNANPEEVFSYLKDALWMNSSIIRVAHNLAFEAMFLYAIGIVVQPPCYDTIAAAQLTLKNRYQFRALSDCGLKRLANAWLDADMATFGEVTDGKYFDELDPADEATIRYACADSDYTLRLYHMLNGWFANHMPQHRRIVEEVESPTAVYCGLMKYNGLLMDVDTMRRKQAETAEKIADIRGRITDLIGDVDIGANASTAAFKRYLYDTLKLPVFKTTATRQEAMDDEALILLTDWCGKNRPELVQLFELVQAYRKLGKISSTYIDGYLRHADTETNRIHPDLMPLATETGRFAARNPNCQNMPRKGNDPVGVRPFIIAPTGKVLLSLDFSQIELRVGAFYCRDEKMLETYRQGGDIHAQTTSVIYHIPIAEAADKDHSQYKERRSIAKNSNFGIFYGLFPRGLMLTLRFKAGLDTTYEECEQIIGNIKTGYPGLTAWQEHIKTEAARRGYVTTWLGRRRYLPYITSQDWGKRSFAERCAMNTPIQGTAADILKLALGRILRGLPERPWLRPVSQIHDELCFEVPAERVDEAVRFIKACMEAPPFPEFDVPVVAEAACGPDFGHMKEIV